MSKAPITREINLAESNPYFAESPDIDHPGKDKKIVISEVIDSLPEESFCFLNEGKLRDKVYFINENFLPGMENKAVAYAVKANPRNRILETLSNSGITHFDCASVNEIKKVMMNYLNPEILFNHPIKRRLDIKEATNNGVKHFTAQSESEIRKVIENSSQVNQDNIEVALRLRTDNPNADINLSEKYGAEKGEVEKMVELVLLETNFKLGLSIHTGSQNRNPEIFSQGIEKMAQIANKVGEIGTLNIGGGIPVEYSENDKFDIKKYFEIINLAIKSKIDQKHLSESKIIIELGRAIIAEAVDLVIPVIAVEKINGKKSVYLNDGLFTSFSDMALHNWQYHFQVFSQKKKLSEGWEEFKLCGRTCDSGDVMGSISLPSNIGEGDYLLLEKSGAYTDSQSTHFNGFEPPKYVSYNI